MERYTHQKCIEIVKIHYKNGENFAETVHKVESFLGRREAPYRPAIVKLVQISSYWNKLVMWKIELVPVLQEYQRILLL